MRVALVYIPAKDSEPLASLAKSMARAIEAQGHFVDLSQARPGEAPSLTGYDYVIVGTESSSAFGKIPDLVPAMLSQAGMLSGKRSMAFLRKSGLRPEKALSRLMKVMETEGMLVNYAEVLVKEADAAAAAKEAPILRP